MNSFDFAFVDADKVNYPNYYEKLLPLLKKGGWIAFDNAFAGNGVIDKEKYPDFGSNIDVIHSLNLKLRDDPRVSSVLLDLADGVHLVVKNWY